MNRRAFAFLAFLLPQAGSKRTAPAANVQDTTSAKYRPGFCPNCGHYEQAGYIVPTMKVVKNEGSNKLTVTPDPGTVIQLLICLKCHVVFENWT